MSEDTVSDELSYLREEVKRLRASLNRLTPRLDIILRRRGFRIYKKEPSDDLLIPSRKFVDEYYSMLQKYSFRLFLREVIKHQNFFTIEEVTRYATAEVTGEYLDYINRIGLVSGKSGGYTLGRRIKSFGETLEWYVAELIAREFGAEAIRGIKFKGSKAGGDYDVIAKFDGSLFYVEVKSSPPKQIYDKEVAAFLDRVSDLAPEIAVFFMDTELRMKDKIVPMFEAELKRRGPEPPAVVRMEKELFQISGRIFIINAKESIAGNIEKVLRRYFRRNGEPRQI
jgi:Holliday junction resolvase-like predicted endonuclease